MKKRLGIWLGRFFVFLAAIVNHLTSMNPD
jgi:hypothetical protein